MFLAQAKMHEQFLDFSSTTILYQEADFYHRIKTMNTRSRKERTQGARYKRYKKKKPKSQRVGEKPQTLRYFLPRSTVSLSQIDIQITNFIFSFSVFHEH